MSRETEKIFKELEKFLSNREIQGDEEYNQAVKEFMNMHNSKTPEKKGNDSLDYLEMAYEADNEEDTLKYAKKAFQLNKDLLDAEVLIAELTSESREELKKKYEKFIERTKNHLKKSGVLIDENIGHFGGILETRPYMRLRHSYIELLISQGKFTKAIKECEELLVLSEGDNLGIRYKLISLYAFFEDKKNVISLHEKFDGEISSQMLLAIIALYYKLDEEKKAETYLKKLMTINRDIVEVFDDIEGFLEMIIDEDINIGMYQPGSKEELMVAISDSAFLYTTSPEFLFWIADRVVKVGKNKFN
ncbi:MAG: hypothetical protein JJE17_09160 [Peptostreptococcaceae bacterium]|nr:hypothetical protein [Peptostreptococcaceae bacterium]